jgi:lauroyl/myristoyl acyltransferase
VDERGPVDAVGQHLIQYLLEVDDAQRWQEHLTTESLVTVNRLLERGSQILVTSHHVPMRELQAITLLLRNAGMPLQVVANDGTTRVPFPFILTGRSPLHLVNARTALRRGDSVYFVLWRAPMRRRGLLPWEAPEEESRPAAGPVVLARMTGRPITLVRLEVIGRRAARLRIHEQEWQDSGGDIDDEARRLTDAVDPIGTPRAS